MDWSNRILPQIFFKGFEARVNFLRRLDKPFNGLRERFVLLFVRRSAGNPDVG